MLLAKAKFPVTKTFRYVYTRDDNGHYINICSTSTRQVLDPSTQLTK